MSGPVSQPAVAKVKRGPRPAASYWANGCTPSQMQVFAAAPRKSGRAWPNKRSPVLGKRESFRRLQQARRAAHAAQQREWLTSAAAGKEMI